ncbi:uncharacterized protein PHALS_14705 [Plasmopara halstedii]|uniref:Uncharacterized protein n=1 Tax=Plasmopara halstedii TaxID=4781 RepID=A0A0P1AR48_PLAHL|nr:uncharacterized protein PHALS_14705 [Plasmopara halstedii]CEG43377.1 hypothetical protein PHALS_14705 [Plasmopara halstedii]|eukprot:XP_024579746.1 hypothetical protein PHALS_14705 [Plasmopara halstedii]
MTPRHCLIIYTWCSFRLNKPRVMHPSSWSQPLSFSKNSVKRPNIYVLMTSKQAIRSFIHELEPESSFLEQSYLLIKASVSPSRVGYQRLPFNCFLSIASRCYLHEMASRVYSHNYIIPLSMGTFFSLSTSSYSLLLNG